MVPGFIPAGITGDLRDNFRIYAFLET